MHRLRGEGEGRRLGFCESKFKKKKKKKKRARLHEGAAPGGDQAEHGEGVDDEAQLFVGQQRVDQDEPGRRQQQGPRASVREAQRDEEQRGAQSAGHGGVEVPEEGRGLLGGRSQGEAGGGQINDRRELEVAKRIFPSLNFC